MFKHFNHGEFFPSCSAAEIAYAVRNPIISDNILRSLGFLDEIRSYMDEPLIINSGYRDLRHNKLVLGSPTSHHMRGTAVDIRNPKNMIKLKNWIEHHKSLFYQVIYYPRWVHLDFRLAGDGTPSRFIFDAQ